MMGCNFKMGEKNEKINFNFVCGTDGAFIAI